MPGIDSYITLRNNKHPLNFTHFVVVFFFSSEKYIGVCEEDVVLILFRRDLVADEKECESFITCWFLMRKIILKKRLLKRFLIKIMINHVEKY